MKSILEFVFNVVKMAAALMFFGIYMFVRVTVTVLPGIPAYIIIALIIKLAMNLNEFISNGFLLFIGFFALSFVALVFVCLGLLGIIAVSSFFARIEDGEMW